MMGSASELEDSSIHAGMGRIPQPCKVILNLLK